MITSGYEPRFDHDYDYGHQGELLVDGLIDGIRKGTVRLETKTKRRRDSWYYIETAHDPGARGLFVPSGVSVTTADYWTFAVDTTGIVVFVPVDRLHAAVAMPALRDAPPPSGSCPTHGKLVSFERLASTRCDP